MSFFDWNRKTRREAVKYLALLGITDSFLVTNISQLRKQAYEAGERAGRRALIKELKDKQRKKEKKND